jgi:glycosyltransferase 2 family protein
MTTLEKKVRKGLKIFLVLVVLTMLALLVFSDPDPEKKFSFNIIHKISYAFKQINYIYLLFALIFWMIHILLDSLRVSLLCQGVTGRWGNLRTSAEVILTGAFLAAVTPFQTGGLPVQLYLFKRDGISYGKGTLIILLRAIFYSIMMLILLPFLFPILTKQYDATSIKILSKYSLIVYPIIVLIIAFALIKPAIIKISLYKLTRLLGKRKNKAKKLVDRMFKEIDEMKDGFWHFVREKKWHSISSFFLTFIAYIPYFFIAPLLLKGMGIDVSFIRIAFLQLVVVLFTFFSPTPGATGISEGVFAIMFIGIVGKGLLGVFTILWRFFTFHLTALVGGIMTLDVLKLGSEEFDE